MTRKETITKAKELLEPYHNKYESKVKELWWVEKDCHSVEVSENFCEECIDEAVKKERRDYLLEQCSLPIDERDKEFSKFRKWYSYDYENECFLFCSNCNAPLHMLILPFYQEIEDIIDYIKNYIEDGKTDDYGTYHKAYKMLCNDWNNLEKRPEEYHLTLELAELVIKKLK